MNPVQMIAEWEKGCSCGKPGECEACTLGLINAIKGYYKKGPRVSRLMKTVRAKFVERLQAKTGWGRNDLIGEFDQALAEAIAEEMDHD